MKTMLTSSRNAMVTAMMMVMSVAAPAALANDPIGGILQHAKNLERDSMQVKEALKSRKPNLDEIRTAVAASAADVSKLQELVAAFEATNPVLNAQERKDWDLLKQKVQLLSIFHSRKKELLDSGDLSKHRNLIKAHAEGLAKRAAMLQNTASRLERKSLSSSGS